MRRGTYLLLLCVVAAGFLSTRAPHRPRVSDAPLAASWSSAMQERATHSSNGNVPTSRANELPGAAPRPLFTFVEPANATELAAAMPAPSHNVQYVRVDSGAFAGKASPFWQKAGEGRVAIPLPGGGALSVVIESSDMLGADRFISRGEIEGRPGSRASFAYNEGFLHATVEDPELGTFALRVITPELSQFYRVAADLVPPCGGARAPTMERVVMAALAERERRARAGEAAGAAGAVATPPSTAAADNPQRAEVHVMMLYTQAVLPLMTGSARAAAAQSAFDEGIERVNAALAASLVSTRVKLVRVAETTYDENASAPEAVQDDALTAVYRTDDGKMDEIHALRDQSGADVVCLALARPDAVSSGLSFLLDEPGDYGNALFAFAIVDYDRVGGTRVLAHELGHLFGCAHDRANALSGEGAYPYSYGYRFVGADRRTYRDIMAYARRPNVPDDVAAVELPYFSNPRLFLPAPISAPIGVAAGEPGEADNALTIEQNAHIVANYRLQTQAAAFEGTLLNVATRAFVGTGDQVLIGGFVVSGAEPKRMLVRGAGPALGSFGVADPLLDPVLRVFRDGNSVGENDDWGAQAGAADVAAAAVRAGAFPFAAGSQDSALLLQLPPGAYTAVVEGAADRTGAGLVEAYEVDGGRTRIINLATRGYADNRGGEMVGGFVVSAPAGTTKRILVRVLGPTLARAPYHMTGTLFDPYLELRGADGTLLIANDDWTSGARTTAGDRDDFQPTVRYYSEQQISETGFAPSNRREPCLLVDLPAGNFTVVAKPFEFRDPNPDLDQPARPGVGIVEVYEIQR